MDFWLSYGNLFLWAWPISTERCRQVIMRRWVIIVTVPIKSIRRSRVTGLLSLTKSHRGHTKISKKNFRIYSHPPANDTPPPNDTLL